ETRNLEVGAARRFMDMLAEVDEEISNGTINTSHPHSKTGFRQAVGWIRDGPMMCDSWMSTYLHELKVPREERVRWVGKHEEIGHPDHWTHTHDSRTVVHHS
ncbi:hypothetical protein PTTG_27312, partial [Puccinia triticina 1-1 BBBD Race 1]